MRHSLPLRSLVVLLSWAALAVPVAAQAEAAGGITVSGHGVVYGAPDLATLQLGVDIVDPDVRAALSGANAAMEKVRQVFRDGGVAEEDIRTVAFNLWREDRYDRDGAPQGPVYHVVNSVEVTVRDSAEVGELLVAAVEAGANQIGGVSYSFDNPAELRRRARETAVADARAKAEQLATATGVTLGAPLEIVEGSPADGGPLPMQRMSVASEAAPVSGGQLAVEVSVNVRYAIGSGGDDGQP